MSEKRRARLVLETDGEKETVWAHTLGQGRYRLDSVPFLAYNVSLEDTVEATLRRGGLQARRVVEKSGHRTVRVILTDPKGDAARGLVRQLEGLGCGCEGYSPTLLAVDIPPAVDLETVTDACDAAEVEWEYGDPQPDRPPYTAGP